MAKNNILLRSKLKKAQNLVETNQLIEARSAYVDLYKKNKSNITIGLELAVVHRKLGEFAKTEKISKDIVNKSPKNADAHHIYGSALQCLGNRDQAITEYKDAIKINPKHVQAYYFLGNLYQEMALFENAAECYKHAVSLAPNFFEALNNLGAVLVELHRPIEAKEILDRAIKISPNSLQLLCNIAGFYLLESNFEKAVHYTNMALRNDPDFIDALKLSGKINYQLPDYDKALADYRKAYALNNEQELLGYIGQILERRGEFEEANELITPLIKSGNTDYAVLMTYSALGRKYNHQKEAIQLIEKALTTSTLDKAAQLNLHSELGKQYDNLEDYKNAFHHYNRANLIEQELNQQIESLNKTRDLNNTNTDDVKKWFDEFPKSFWDNLPTSNNTSSKPVFIIGMFRSGTTLCEQILASHPDIYGAGELLDIHQISVNIHKSDFHDQSPTSLINISQNQLSEAAIKYLETLNKHSSTAKCVVNKMPANFFHVGLISKLFPNSKIIHMIRDPRDVCTSMFFQRFGNQMNFATDLESLADYHLAYQKMMEYWHTVLEIDILDIVYEELISNQEEITRKMIDFCGLDWDERCLSFYKTKRDVNTPSYDQVRKPIYKKSVARWKNYEEFLQPLLRKLENGGSTTWSKIYDAT